MNENFASYELSNKTPSLQRKIAGLTVVGHSRSAWSTVFLIKELDIQFDAGAFLQHAPPKHIFLSHSHADHSVTVARQKHAIIVPQIYIPAETQELLEQHILQAESYWHSDSKYVFPKLTYKIVPCVAGEQRVIVLNNTQYKIEVVQCFHTVPCVGYGLSKETTKLKSEYQGMDGKELGLLRKQGVELSETRFVPVMLYLGDTDERVFAQPKVFEYPVIIVECTFLTDDEIERAKKTNHMHYQHLKPILEQHLDTTFVLIHFSLRYTVEEIKQFFVTHHHSNVLLWI